MNLQDFCRALLRLLILPLHIACHLDGQCLLFAPTVDESLDLQTKHCTQSKHCLSTCFQRTFSSQLRLSLCLQNLIFILFFGLFFLRHTKCATRCDSHLYRSVCRDSTRVIQQVLYPYKNPYSDLIRRRRLASQLLLPPLLKEEFLSSGATFFSLFCLSLVSNQHLHSLWLTSHCFVSLSLI